MAFYLPGIRPNDFDRVHLLEMAINGVAYRTVDRLKCIIAENVLGRRCGRLDSNGDSTSDILKYRCSLSYGLTPSTKVFGLLDSSRSIKWYRVIYLCTNATLNSLGQRQACKCGLRICVNPSPVAILGSTFYF